MRKVICYMLLCLAASLAALRAEAQELRIGADFTTLFDNKEYSSMSYDDSWTLFSARLTPKVGVAWAERNELMFAVDMVQDFGSSAKFLSDVNVQLYYGYRSPRLLLMAGIFPREEMRGLATPLFFDRDYRYYNNRIAGVLARYEGKSSDRSFVEFAFDYTGMRNFDTREAFMIMSAGEHAVRGFCFGYDLMVGHYAKDDNPATDDGVVDNILATPHVGYDVTAGGFDIALRLSYVQSLQRDRHFENRWLAPLGGELYCSISRWGVTLSNRLYLGDSLLPHYDRYGGELYYGTPFYRTTEGIYDAITASYGGSFFHDTVAVAAGITMEYDGTGWGTRQWLQVSVALDYGISLERKRDIVE